MDCETKRPERQQYDLDLLFCPLCAYFIIFPHISFQVLRIPRRNYAYAWGFGDPFQKRLATKFQQELSFPIGTFFLFPEKEMGLPTPVASWTGPCTRIGPAGGIPDQPGSQTANLICQHFRKIPKSANLCPGFWCSKMWIQGDISGETAIIFMQIRAEWAECAFKAF